MSTWDTYMVGVLIGLVCGLVFGYVIWQLPVRQRAYLERLSDPTIEYLERMRSVPLRSMDDIANDREPTVEMPVVAVAMQPEAPVWVDPQPYRGPRIWNFNAWVLWNFGDWIAMTNDNASQERGSYRMV